MFTDISLCPGGSMMFCESVAEFDPNAAEMQHTDGNTPEDIETANKLKEQLAPSKMYCPVGALIEKLRPSYNMINKLIQTPMDVESSEEQIKFLNEISYITTNVTDAIICSLVKQGAFLRFADDNRVWRYEPLKIHLGWFIKNYNRVISKGFGVYTRNMLAVPGFGSWQINRAINLYIGSSDKLHSVSFEINQMYDITNYDKNDRVFESTYDMIHCVFDEPDRLERLTRPYTDSSDLETMINSCACNDPIRYEGNESRNNDLISWISKTMRMVKCGCYELQCDVMDPDVTVESFLARVRPLVTGAINIFFVGTIKLISDAYVIKSIIDNRNSLQDYVDCVMDACKH